MNTQPGVHRLQGEWPTVLTLVALYFLQGVPLGLALGSMPFLLQAESGQSMTSIGLFTMCSYPYSLKVLWSPIVDSFYSRRMGRRKSWIVPVMLLGGILMVWASWHVEALMREGMATLSALFMLLVGLVATQDIAVDALAISLLSRTHVGYASTIQNIGLNSGFFLSFTVLLALQSRDFCSAYMPFLLVAGQPVVTVGGYMRVWGVAWVVAAAALVPLAEGSPPPRKKGRGRSLADAYRVLLRFFHLPHFTRLMFVLMVSKVGFVVSTSVAPLKLIALGFRKENLALFALIEFPAQVVFALAASRLSRGARPLQPFLHGFLIKAALVPASMALIFFFPTDPNTLPFGGLVLAVVLASSLATNLMAVSMGGFFARIADPAIGGTYLTFLNTLMNLGGTWPRVAVFFLVDRLSAAECHSAAGAVLGECVSSAQQQWCRGEAGGVCTVQREGYHAVGAASIVVCVVVFVAMRPLVARLQATEPHTWRFQEAEELEVVTKMV